MYGLKKLGAKICADMGASDRQLIALFDWTSEKQANAYTRKANRTKLAKECASFLGHCFAPPKDEERTSEDERTSGVAVPPWPDVVSPKICL